MKTRSKALFHDALLGAAVSGLLVAGCAGDDAPADDAPHELGRSEHTDLTVAQFKDICEERGGLTQVHASCSGTNACRGLILNTWATEVVNGEQVSTVVEHTCRGFNSCVGISCVDMPADSGLSGQDVYEEHCTGCHQHADEDDNASFYAVFRHPDVSDEAALAAFEAKSDATLVNNVAFGSVGFYPDGTPYSNMPAYHEKISLAEARRVVAYLTSLEARTEVVVALGINQEIGAEPEPEQH